MKPQTTQLFEHLKAHGSITQVEAYELYGNTRAAAAVFEMRKSGIPVVTERKEGKNRFGETCTFAQYRLLKEDA